MSSAILPGFSVQSQRKDCETYVMTLTSFKQSMCTVAIKKKEVWMSGNTLATHDIFLFLSAPVMLFKL